MNRDIEPGDVGSFLWKGKRYSIGNKVFILLQTDGSEWSGKIIKFDNYSIVLEENSKTKSFLLRDITDVYNK